MSVGTVAAKQTSTDLLALTGSTGKKDKKDETSGFEALMQSVLSVNSYSDTNAKQTDTSEAATNQNGAFEIKAAASGQTTALTGEQETAMTQQNLVNSLVNLMMGGTEDGQLMQQLAQAVIGETELTDPMGIAENQTTQLGDMVAQMLRTEEEPQIADLSLLKLLSTQVQHQIKNTGQKQTEPNAAQAVAKDALQGQDTDLTAVSQKDDQLMALQSKDLTKSVPADTTQKKEEKVEVKLEAADTYVPQAADSKAEVVTVEIPEGSKNPSEVLMQKLGDAITQKTAQGIQEFEISVTPKSLGNIHMKIEFAQSEVRISITCQEHKTLNMLSEHTTDIARIVEQNMTQVNSQNAKADSDYLQQQSQDQRQQRQQQEAKKKKEESEDFLQMLRLGMVV